jgi:2,3-bisphosphoglycerate-dependent phosphoglycerate mutase
MRTYAYLIRHAHSVYTSEELERPLSERGLKDAKIVTELLSAENITHVVSSPYKRAIQTVEGTASYFGLSISINEGLKERILADGPVDNFDGIILKAWEDFDFSMPQGETGNTAQKRGVQAFTDILDKYSGGNIVIGTHGNIMVLIMNYYDKKYNYDFWTNLEMPDIYKLSFENGKLEEVKHIWRK